MATGRYYLRPVGDISYQHNISDDTLKEIGAFAALNEDVVDTAYIYASRASSDKEFFSTFRMGYAPPINDKFTKMTLCIHFGNTSQDLSKVGDESFTVTINGKSEVITGTKDKKSGLVSLDLPNSLINLNNYISANGSFPEITLMIYTYMSGYGDNKSFNYRYYYQAYIELSIVNEIYYKINNSWTPSVRYYRRISDTWQKLTVDETKSILTSNLIQSGHESSPILGYPPTCTENGLTTGYQCSICGVTLVEQEIIPALGHSPVVVPGYSETCGSAGLTDGQKCSRCGAILTAQQTIPATGNHTYVKSNSHNVCTVCGHVEGMGYVSLSYHGTATSLSVSRMDLAATTVGNYALFGGGDNSDEVGTVDAYNASLTRTIATSLSVGREALAATNVGDYALFGGGRNGTSEDNYLGTVDAYNASLTRTIATSLSFGREALAATSVGNYALFGGGEAYLSNRHATVDAYNASLTRTIATSLSVSRMDLAATTVGNYALFGGGSNGSDELRNVDAYNASLTRTIATSLSLGADELAATSVGNYALFGGGWDEEGDYTTRVHAYNTSLTQSRTTLHSGRKNLAATTVGNYALFGGGLIDAFNDDAEAARVDVFDHSLVHSTSTSLSVGRRALAATSVGNYALFGGGIAGSYQATVDAYKIS